MTEELDLITLVPRFSVKMKRVNGKLWGSENDDTSKIPALVKVVPDPENPPDCLEGTESGTRSALLTIDGRPMKYKGVAVEDAYNSPRMYSEFYGTDDTTPYGGSLVRDARREIQITRRVNNILNRHGHEINHLPVGYFNLRKKFGRTHHDGTEIIGCLGISVMGIKGDTRLVELFRRCYWNGSTESVVYKFGLELGSQLRLLREEGFIWGHPNINLGNFVVYVAGDKAHIGVVDFDAAEFSNDRSYLFYQHLLEDVRLGTIFSMKSAHDTPSCEFYLRFGKGYREGYATPTRRREVPLQELQTGFRLALF